MSSKTVLTVRPFRWNLAMMQWFRDNQETLVDPAIIFATGVLVGYTAVRLNLWPGGGHFGVFAYVPRPTRSAPDRKRWLCDWSLVSANRTEPMDSHPCAPADQYCPANRCLLEY